MIERTRDQLTDAQESLVRGSEEQLSNRFDTYRIFPRNTLRRLQQAQIDPISAERCVSPEPSLIRQAAATLERIANLHSPGETDRRAYLEALLEIYRVLPDQPDQLLRNSRELFVGVEREGRILAEKLGWLPANHAVRVHAKRMRPDGDLLVALSDLPTVEDCDELVIIDGAIASGATLMAIVGSLPITRVRVYSAHATAEGLRSLFQFAREHGIDLRISVGFVTSGLDRRYYAVEKGRKVVGDLGDMIAPLTDSEVFDLDRPSPG